MNTAPSTASRLFHRPDGTALPQPDPADMGCCLGLELSYGAVMPATPQQVAAPRAVAASLANWWRRLHITRPAPI